MDSTGTVTGVAAGSATVTATIEGTTLSASCTVTVIEPSRFVKADNFEDGGEYILAYVDGGTAYCLDSTKVSTNSSATTADATNTDVEDATITTPELGLTWKVTGSGDGWYIQPAAGSSTEDICISAPTPAATAPFI